MEFVLLWMLLFEILCVPSVFLHMSLSVVTVVWVLVSILISIFIVRKKIKATGKIDLKKEYAAPNYIQILCLLLILFQIFLVIAYRHTDDDDAFYLGCAVSAYETDEMYVFSPYTGEEMPITMAGDYVLSPLPMLWGGLGLITHIHPTILAHTFVPVLMIIWAYTVYYLLGRRLFSKGRGSDSFLLFMNVLNLFGFYSIRTTGTFLLFRSWQGKAVFCAIMVPLLFYYFLGLMQEGKTSNSLWSKNMLGIYLTMGAALLSCFSAVTLMPLLLGEMAVTYAFCTKTLKKPFLMLGAAIPNVLLLAIYVLQF